MLGGINDAAEMRGACALLAPLKSVKVNLIPWNPGELPYRDRLRNGLRSSGKFWWSVAFRRLCATRAGAM